MSATPTSTYSTKVIVLTGASGYLGQHCLRELIEHGYDANNDTAIAVDRAPLVGTDDDKITAIPSSLLIIYALVHQSSSKKDLSEAITSYYDSCSEDIKSNYEKNVSVITVALDLTSPTACDEWFATLRPPFASSIISIDCCIHTAALSSPSICEQQPEYALSINVPTYFLQKLFQNNPKINIIALSTDQVYDGNISAIDNSDTSTNCSNFYNESSKCEPCNIYGASKVELENYLTQEQQLQYPQASVILLRSSIMLGPKVPYLPDKAHTTFLHFCHSRIHESTTYYTNEIRSVIAVSDVARVIVRMMSHYVAKATTAATDPNEEGKCEVYCMGGPTPVNRYEMATAVLSHFHVADPSNDIAVPVLKENPSPNATSGTTIVRSPLNITMDSTKLLQFMGDGCMKFHSLSDIVVQTFPDSLNKA